MTSLLLLQIVFSRNFEISQSKEFHFGGSLYIWCYLQQNPNQKVSFSRQQLSPATVM